LQQDLALRGLPLPDWRTIHRAWVAAGLVTPRGLGGRRKTEDARGAPILPPPDTRLPPYSQDGPYVGHHGRRVRAPAADLTIGAGVFAQRRDAHAVSEDAIPGSSIGDRDHRGVTGRPETGDGLDWPDVSPDHASAGRIK
jgi:hypothetical protein